MISNVSWMLTLYGTTQRAKNEVLITFKIKQIVVEVIPRVIIIILSGHDEMYEHALEIIQDCVNNI